MKSELQLHDPQYFIRLLVIVALGITLTVATIIYNNSLRSVPVFLFLLALGIALMAALGWRRGGILGFLLVSILIIIKQFIGAWSLDNLSFNLLEISLIAGVFGLSGYYHDMLRLYLADYNDAKQKIKILDMEEPAVGLIRPAIGLLRLKEESDRAVRFKYPVSLVLILALPKSGVDWEPNQRISIMRAIATTIKDTTRVLDIPFLVSDEKIGLILTNTGTTGTNTVISNIQRRLNDCRIITKMGQSEPLQQYAQMRFGYSVFLGYSTKPIEMLTAAEIALKRSIDANVGGIFQNVFIDWETLGETVISQTSGTVNPKEIPGKNDLDLVVFEHNPQ